MRHILHKIALLAAALMIMAVPVLADEGSAMSAMEPAQQTSKDECLLVAMNCKDQVDSVQQRIDRFQNEINRGTDVYTNDELKRFQDKIDDANRNLNELMSGGA